MRNRYIVIFTLTFIMWSIGDYLFMGGNTLGTFIKSICFAACAVLSRYSYDMYTSDDSQADYKR